ncbi:hypothetical protein HPB50_019104 [Hyalomma asiaticum]|uniref:Uncharacterized protein n=1 Tax=Hyalomma asiaticum TaxID=266040 RepID=A0ACB7SRW6_HYAAI|nr:hypothetical protein HPB50_019104 [Hyalomma asiaticum]
MAGVRVRASPRIDCYGGYGVADLQLGSEALHGSMVNLLASFRERFSRKRRRARSPAPAAAALDPRWQSALVVADDAPPCCGPSHSRKPITHYCPLFSCPISLRRGLRCSFCIV